MSDYNKRLVEVDEVLKYLSKENLEKIPEDIRKLIKENKDINYIWHYDETKTLKEQGLNRDTIAFLSYLNMEYLLDEKQKSFIEQLHRLNEQKIEEQKQKSYANKDLFKKRDKSESIEKSNTQEKDTFLTEYKENYFTRFKNFILKLLNIKR